MKRGMGKTWQRKEGGFSIAAVLVGIGLLGVMVTFLMLNHHKGEQGQKSLLGESDALTVTGNMATLLADPMACAKTFGGIDPSVSGNSVTNVLDSTGKVQYSQNGIYGNRTLKLGAITPGGTGVDAKSRLQRWTQTSPTTGLVFVQVLWLRNGGAGSQGLGPTQLPRYFLLNATIDASKKITACTADTSSTTRAAAGAGNTNVVPLWQDSRTLGNSILSQNAKNIGVGTAGLPITALDINGNLALGTYASTTAAPPDGMIVSGKVGVGTPTPTSPLTVRGSLLIDGATKGFVGFQAPLATAAPLHWALPQGNGLPGQILTTDGHGNLSWAYCAPPPPGCDATVISDCQLANTPSGGASGTCVPGDTGACSYTCNNKVWTLANNSCAKNCAATTIGNCVLPAAPSGTNAGSCAPGFAGACNYLCTNGTWGPPSSDTCSCPPGNQSYTSPGHYTFSVPLCFSSLHVQVWGGGGGGQGGGVLFGIPIVTGGGSGGDSSFAGVLVAQGGQCTAGGNAWGGATNLKGQDGNWNGTNCSGAGGAAPLGGGPNGGWPGGGGGGICFGWGASGGGGGGYTTATFGSGSLTPGSIVNVDVGGGGGDRGAGGEVLIDWN
jgi:hypothetical protein